MAADGCFRSDIPPSTDQNICVLVSHNNDDYWITLYTRKYSPQSMGKFNIVQIFPFNILEQNTTMSGFNSRLGQNGLHCKRAKNHGVKNNLVNSNFS